MKFSACNKTQFLCNPTETSVVLMHARDTICAHFLDRKLSVCIEAAVEALPRTEAPCLSDRGSLSLRQRLSVHWTEALCPLDRGSLSLGQRLSVPWTEALCPLDRGSLSLGQRLSVPWTEALCPLDRGSLPLGQRLSVRMKGHRLWPSLRQCYSQ